MKKSTLIIILLAMMILIACGNRQQDKAVNSSSIASSLSSSAVSKASESAKLTVKKLTPEQTAALVLYYGDAHMPGAMTNDYSANMEKDGQEAIVKVYSFIVRRMYLGVRDQILRGIRQVQSCSM